MAANASSRASRSRDALSASRVDVDDEGATSLAEEDLTGPPLARPREPFFFSRPAGDAPPCLCRPQYTLFVSASRSAASFASRSAA